MIHKWGGPARQSLRRWGLAGHRRSEPWITLVNLDFTRFPTWNPISNKSPSSWGPSQSKLAMSQWIYNLTMSTVFKWIAYISVSVYIVWWWGFSNVAVEALQRWLKLKMYGPAGHLKPKHKWRFAWHSPTLFEIISTRAPPCGQRWRLGWHRIPLATDCQPGLITKRECHHKTYFCPDPVKATQV